MIEDATRQAIERAFASNDIAAAAGVAETALAAGQRDPMLFNLAAWQRGEAGDFAGAHLLLAQALTLAPGDILIRTSIGALLRGQGKLEEARTELAAVVAETPDCVAALLELGYVLDDQGAYAQAGRCYRRITELDAGCAPAFARLATAAARTGRADEVRAFAGRALALDPRNVGAVCALAASDVEQGSIEQAQHALTALLQRADLPPEDRVVALTLSGDAFDRLGLIDHAFSAYISANAVYARHYEPAEIGLHGRETHRMFVERLDAELLANDWSAPPLPDDPSPGAQSHAFLIGFPRSGATLVENILTSVPGVVATEEKPLLEKSDLAFLAERGGLARLAAIDAGAAAGFRADYWRRARSEQVSLPTILFVDMDPLKTLRLPIIAKLFPAASILIMRRDPRDVVWSCFRHNFRITAASLEFTGLERTARHYDRVMRFLHNCLERLPLRAHVVDYADLVGAFDQTTGSLSRFLDLPPSNAMRDFADTARRRGVGTASAPQVRRGLYDGGGQWRRYANYLEPVMPLLEPWIERFGIPA